MAFSELSELAGTESMPQRSEMMRFLDAQGHFNPTGRVGGDSPSGDGSGGGFSAGPEVFQGFLEELDASRLREAYRGMALTRRFDQEATSLQRQGELALWVPSLGQEAAQMGAALAAEKQDYVFPTYREHAIAWYRGVSPEELLSLFRGAAHGGWDPRVTRFHLYTLVLAAQTLHAVGYAMGIQRDQARNLNKNKNDPGREAAEAVLAFFGDGASSEGDVHESMVFAASFQAPVVFFCQNNHWAISVPSSVQSRVPLAERAQGYGFPGIQVDGNDVLAVYAATRWALERARSGKGPALIEAVTYRLGAHTTADDPTKYRSQEEEAQWQERDPIPRLAEFLRSQGHAGPEFFAGVEREGAQLAEEFREATARSADADLRESFTKVYGQVHPLISEELSWFEDYEAGFLIEETAEDGQ